MADTGTGRGKGGWLDAAAFEVVVASTPLISIDLLVRNELGEYLLGMRTNRPAQGFWFVPGGRVQKNETLDAAFLRLTADELGVKIERQQAVFAGIFEHLYQDSVFGAQPSTHYIALAYQLVLPANEVELSVKQHCNAGWFSVKNILLSPEVHSYTKNYFHGN